MAHGRKTGGRQKGTPNKTTTQAKEAIAKAYASIGGDDTFADWAKDNQTEFYKLFARLLPVEGPGADGEHLHKLIHEMK